MIFLDGWQRAYRYELDGDATHFAAEFEVNNFVSLGGTSHESSSLLGRIITVDILGRNCGNILLMLGFSNPISIEGKSNALSSSGGREANITIPLGIKDATVNIIIVAVSTYIPLEQRDLGLQHWPPHVVNEDRKFAWRRVLELATEACIWRGFSRTLIGGTNIVVAVTIECNGCTVRSTTSLLAFA